MQGSGKNKTRQRQVHVWGLRDSDLQLNPMSRSLVATILASLTVLASLPLPGLAQIAPKPTGTRSRTFPALPTDGYILGPGDRLTINIFNVPENSGEFPVLSDGTLNLPLVGSLCVEGLTIPQTTRILTERFARYLRRPLLTVSLIQPRPLRVAVAGEVNRPGAYAVEAGPATVTDAIRLAGGITQAANVRRVEVLRSRPRQSGQGQSVCPSQILNTPQVSLSVDLWALAQSGDLRQDLRLQDGDSVVIPASTNLKLEEAPQLVNTSFAPAQAQPLEVAVIGAVQRPGPHVVGPERTQDLVAPVTVTRAIQAAGGITQVADVRQVQVRRQTKAGAEQIIPINLWKLLQTGDLNQDIPLQRGDTIIVPVAENPNPSEVTELALSTFSPAAIIVNVVGEVRRPGPVQVRPNTPLNQALLAAGSFNRSAERASVTLVRLNPNGTVSKRKIKVDFKNNVDEASNPPLKDNDTVIVRQSAIAGAGNVIRSILTPVTGVFSFVRIFD